MSAASASSGPGWSKARRAIPMTCWAWPHGATVAEARKAWKALVRDTHPDVMQARGVPPEAMTLAERRLIMINAAWKEISAKEAA